MRNKLRLIPLICLVEYDKRLIVDTSRIHKTRAFYKAIQALHKLNVEGKNEY